MWKSVGLLLADSLEDARSTSAFESSDASSSKRASTSSSPRGRLLRAAAPVALPVPAPAAAPSSKQVQAPKYNYVLGADQDSIVQHLQQLGSAEGPVPGLIYLNGNVTLSKPPVPAGGIAVARPMVIVGLAGEAVGIDFHMQVRTASSTGFSLLTPGKSMYLLGSGSQLRATASRVVRLC